LGDGLVELGFEESDQFLLGEGQALSFALPQPDPTLRRHFVRVAVAVVDERFPGRAALAIVTAELGQIVPAEGQVQLLAQRVEVLSLIQSQQELLLGPGSFDLTGGVAFHRIPPRSR
jgi:hypothetical protein